MIPKKIILVLKNMIMVPMKMIIVPKKISAFMNYQWKESNFGQYVLSEVLTWYVLYMIISYIFIILQIWSGRVNCRHFWLQWRRRRIWSNYLILAISLIQNPLSLVYSIDSHIYPKEFTLLVSSLKVVLKARFNDKCLYYFYVMIIPNLFTFLNRIPLSTYIICFIWIILIKLTVTQLWFDLF